MARFARQALRWLALAAAVYTAALLLRYFVTHGPRFQVESAFFIFVALGAIAVLLHPGDEANAVRQGPPEGGHYERDDGLNLALLIAAFVAGAFAVYAPALRIGLLSDDFVIAGWADRLELVHFDATGFVRPGVPVFWWVLGLLPGDFATAAHAANVVLHGVNGALVSLVAGRLGLRSAESVAAGAMFAVFPGLSEAVAWASGAQDVLMTTLVLAAVALATAGKPRVVLAVLASAAALLVKETAVVIPALAGLVVLARGPDAARRYLTALIALTAISLVYVLARLVAGVPSSFLEIADWQYFIKQLVANSFATLGAPWTDDWGRTHSTLAIVRALLILALAASAFVRWRRNDATFRAAVASAAWVLAGALPAFTLFYIGPQLEGARYVYLPAAGFTILLALLAGLAADRFAVPARPAVMGLLAGVLAVPFLPAIASDLRRWEAAAAARADVLARVPEQAARAGCTTYVAEGDADSVAGAYVFRHGLAEALGMHDRDEVVSCRVSVKSGEIVLSRSDR